MEFPQSVIQIVQQAAKACHTPEEAATKAEREIRELPEFPDIVDELLRRAVRRMVNDARHHITVRAKREIGGYSPKPKVTGVSAAVKRAAASYYDLISMGGTKLGEILVSDLPAVANSEREIGNGHIQSAVLAERLYALVPQNKRDKKLRNALPEARLVRVLKEVGISVKKAA